MSKEMFSPFSNGSEAIDWYSHNCDTCKKAWFPKVEGEYPKEKTLRQYVREGKYCKMQYDLDLGFIIGEIPMESAQLIGMGKDYGLKETCMMWSDKDDDNGKKPRKPRDPSGPNQLCLPIELIEIERNTLKPQLTQQH